MTQETDVQFQKLLLENPIINESLKRQVKKKWVKTQANHTKNGKRKVL